MDQTALVAELRQLAAYEWPRLWSSVYAHREACMAELVAHLEYALDDPKATRQGLRRQLRAEAQRITEWGP